MATKRAVAIIAAVIAGLALSAIAIVYFRGQQSALAEEIGLSITGIELNRRTHALVGVNVTSSLSSDVGIRSASLVKIQSGITVASTSFSPVRKVSANSQSYLPIGFSLDPEGADYFLYLVTDRGTAVKQKISYP